MPARLPRRDRSDRGGDPARSDPRAGGARALAHACAARVRRADRGDPDVRPDFDARCRSRAGAAQSACRYNEGVAAEGEILSLRWAIRRESNYFPGTAACCNGCCDLRVADLASTADRLRTRLRCEARSQVGVQSSTPTSVALLGLLGSLSGFLLCRFLGSAGLACRGGLRLGDLAHRLLGGLLGGFLLCSCFLHGHIAS